MSPEALAVGHVAAAFLIARRLTVRIPWLRDEAESAALVGLWDAARSFDPARCHRFAPYADRRIRGAVQDTLRVWSPRGYQRAGQRARVGPAPPRVHAEAEMPFALSSAPAPGMAPPSDPEGWARVAPLLARLTDRQRAVLVARYGLDGDPPRGWSEIAAGLGVCKQRPAQLEAAALARLRRWAEEGTA